MDWIKLESSFVVEDYQDLPQVNESAGSYTTSGLDLCQSAPVVVPKVVFEHFRGLESELGTGFCWNNLSLGDLQGATLRMSVMEYPPMVHLTTSNDPSSPEGFFIDILNILALRMNFKISYAFPREQEWGKLGEDGLWTGMVGDVMYGRADMAIGGLTINEERSNVVDFSQTIMTDDVTLNMKKPSGEALNIHAYMTIFSTDTWISILGVGIFSGVIIFYTHWHTQSQWSMVDSIELFGHLYILKGPNFDGKQALSIRMTLFVTSMFAFLIMTFYTADLTSRMTANEVPKTVSSFQDILDQDMELLIWPGTTTYDYIAQSEFGTPQYEIYQRLLSFGTLQTNLSYRTMKSLLQSDPKFVHLGTGTGYFVEDEIVSVKVDKHFSGRMMTLEEINHIDSVLLPSITICSKQPYKSRGHFFNRSSFEENAYTYEDLFHPSNVDIIQEWGLRMKEVMSQPWGRCFTFETDRMFIARESITLALAKDIEGVVAYVHDRGEEFWLTGDVFPYEVKTQGIKESSECSVRREVWFFFLLTVVEQEEEIYLYDFIAIVAGVMKHFAGRTLTIEEFYQVPKLKFPAFTVCSREPYKKRGHFFNQSAFEENTFHYDDLFHESHQNMMREKGVVMKSITSQVWGRCFNFKSEEEFSARENITLALIPDPPEITLFVHEPGEEFWLNADVFPEEMESEDLDETSDCSILREDFANLHYPGNNKHCSEWNLQEFFQCATQQVKEAIQVKGFYCQTVWWKHFFPNGTPECEMKDIPEIKSIGQWLEDGEEFPIQFPAKPWFYGCPYPCKHVRYSLDCKKSALENTYRYLRNQNQTTGPVFISLFSLLNKVESEEEIYLYDFIAIISGVGGSLGLFLGVSCLEGLMALVALIFGKCRVGPSEPKQDATFVEKNRHFMVKHLEGRTLTIEELYQYPQIKLPAFTICADEHYKQPGHFFNHSSYLENTYQYEEIFHESNLAKLQSK
eukprot:maker-scaffold347_size200506-snap-gene-1.27 protein:Tk02329 transcript:maker-scaffold347_size200506-snap-gene-1.27-mRNA-1 annotation:"glutamate receptor delta-2-like"